MEQSPHEAVFRTTLRGDGQVIIEQVPLTLDVLLHPRDEDQVTQSKPHQRKLHPLADTLERFLKRQEGVAVCSDLRILWKQMGEREVAPDVYVVKGVRDRDAIDHSFDPVDQGGLRSVPSRPRNVPSRRLRAPEVSKRGLQLRRTELGLHRRR